MKAKWNERMQKDMGVRVGRLNETLACSVSEGKIRRQFLSLIDTSFKLTNFPQPQKEKSETDKEEIGKSKKLS